MASAVLASRNEPCWGEKKVYMRKTPNPNPNPKVHIPRDPNPGFVHGGGHENRHQIHALEPEELPAGPSAAVSDDSSSLNRHAAVAGRNRDPGGFVTFNIASYSKRELGELKRKLISELEQVRSVVRRIEASSRSGGHQPPDLVSGSDPKKVRKAVPVGSESEKKVVTAMMKKCGQILSKLMKHRGAIWFNSPVDVVGMGLHDYHQIIKKPMDLGSVKTKLNKGVYQAPLEFASDVKLTFDNALLYNPEGHEVHRLAGQLLKMFEGLYYPAYDKYEKQFNAVRNEEAEPKRDMSGNSWSRAPQDRATRPEPLSPLSALPPNPATAPVPAAIPPTYGKQLQQQQHHQHQHQPPQQQSSAGRMGKQPKPKAKEPNKRAMTLEEKQKLSVGLQSLPSEKMEQVIHIVRRRNGEPMQHGDEIELDFELMDNETLWELDRFVCNCKKTMSKIRRQEAMAGSNAISADLAPVVADGGTTKAVAAGEKSKRGEAGEEDVDIGDEMPSSHYPSLEIEKDASCANSSSSSGSDSSSSSDSDSGSSSDGDSDADDAQTPAVGLRPSPRN